MTATPLRVATLISFSVIILTSSVQARELTLDVRVDAQEAIDRVYYAHQIGATKPFAEVLPRSVQESKVRDYLRQSAALRRFWSTPLISDVLFRELERMAADTRMPERLRELYAALDDGAFALPQEITGLMIGADANLAWDSAAPGAGSGTLYAVLRGALTELPVGSGASEICLDGSLPESELTDQEDPPIGFGFYYLVRAQNACGIGTYGSDSAGAERSSTACP